MHFCQKTLEVNDQIFQKTSPVVINLGNLSKAGSNMPGILQNMDFSVFCQTIDSCAARNRP